MYLKLLFVEAVALMVLIPLRTWGKSLCHVQAMCATTAQFSVRGTLDEFE